jgi:glycosyltransferase involved in cell wall biosynthesis/SAM-dependent methyltransferase
MNILVIGHINLPGGAQRGLRKLVRLLMRRHRVEVVLPGRGNGGEAAHYRALGLACHVLRCDFALPELTVAQLWLAGQDIQALRRTLDIGRFDLVITNTLVVLLGALLAHQAGVPHLFYVHEYLENEELLPTCIGHKAYLAMITEAADGLLACSKFVASQFPASPNVEVLAPHDFARDVMSANAFDAMAPLAIQCIGGHTRRKNARFGLVLCKALRLRGLEVEYHVIGMQANATALLKAEVRRRAVPGVWLHAHVDDPYAINAGKRALTLVAATSEPYGLTIPESLRRSVPAVASRSGGPEELLTDDCLFPVEDLERCAHAVMRVASDYGAASARASDRYRELAAAASGEDALVESLIQRTAGAGARSRASTLLERMDAFRAFLAASPSVTAMVRNIGTVARQHCATVTDADVSKMVERERTQPGSAVAADIAHFDVIPFCHSAGSDALYRDGLGMAVELVANTGDAAQLLTSAYVLSVLLEKRRSNGRNLSVLTLGDGLGLNAIRLGRCGFRVDYANVGASAMTRIAALNCETALGEGQDRVHFVGAADRSYDAIVCLQVAEHVQGPVELVRSLAMQLEPDGLLFLSERFDGIENRWPTHLYVNEMLSHRLPDLVKDVLRCVGINRQPFAKPYVFARRDGPVDRQEIDQQVLWRAAAAAAARLAR